MAKDVFEIILMLSSRNSIKRATAVDMLFHPVSNGCQLSCMALEYALQHDPNYRVKHKILAIFEKLQIKKTNIFWEKHFGFRTG